MKLTVDYHSVVSFYFNPLSNFSSINNSTTLVGGGGCMCLSVWWLDVVWYKINLFYILLRILIIVN